jgi:hypothetical protein
MANMFSLGLKGTLDGNHARNHTGSLGSGPGPSTQLNESTTTESWVDSQQASTSSSSSQSMFPGSVTYGHHDYLHDSKCTEQSEPEFDFSTNDFHFPST